ncbi:MAG: hypothetical protein WKF95_06890 [Rubrobacter sp.]
MSTPEVEAVLAWHEALNAGDAERLASLSHPEVEVGGPQGSANAPCKSETRASTGDESNLSRTSPFGE